MKLEKITFSGVDCNTHLPTLQAMATQYPKLELGILLSKSRSGKDNKYPDFTTIKMITEMIPKEQLSLHLCGKVCKSLLVDGLSKFPIKIENGWIDFPLVKKFARVQLNFDYNDVPDIDFIGLKNILFNHEIIIQLHGRNGSCIPMLKEFNANISGLVDTSKGTGLSVIWKKPCFRGVKCGYAGGLGPGNLKKKLKQLDSILERDEVTWVDMETNIRNNNWFCLDRVNQCLKEAHQFL